MWRRLQLVNSNISFLFGADEGCDQSAQTGCRCRALVCRIVNFRLIFLFEKACGPWDGGGSCSWAWTICRQGWFAPSRRHAQTLTVVLYIFYFFFVCWLRMDFCSPRATERNLNLEESSFRITAVNRVTLFFIYIYIFFFSDWQAIIRLYNLIQSK